MDENTQFPQDIIKTVSTAMADRIYGSVEIYFEDGRVTQITQRIIKKINNSKNRIKISIRDRIKDNGEVSDSSSIKFTT